MSCRVLAGINTIYIRWSTKGHTVFPLQEDDGSCKLVTRHSGDAVAVESDSSDKYTSSVSEALSSSGFGS